MTNHASCPVAMCMWLLGKVSTPPVPDGTAEVPPWCLPTWEVVSGGYGSCLTAAQVVAAHVASHLPADRSTRMPSRAEVEAAQDDLLAITEAIAEQSDGSIAHV